MAWWGAAWLGLSFGLSLLAWAGLAISLGRSIFDADKIGLLIFFVVDVVGLALMVVLTLVIRRSQPRWAVVAVFGLLLLSLLGQLLPPRLGLPLIIDAALTYVTLHSVRGAWRVAAFRRGLRTPTQAAKVFD